MKKVILTTLMSVAAVAAFAQGTINFANDGGAISSPPDRFVRYGPGAAAKGFTPGTAAGGTNIQIQLYYGVSGTPESSLVPLTAAPARLRVSTSTSVGTWSAGGTRTFTGQGPGATLVLQVRAWDIAFGATYDAAFNNPANDGLLGKSQLFTYVVPQTTDPPASFNMANFVGFNIEPVPEPASFALAGLGAAALLIFRRRK
jgi:hypothetical protein